MLKSQRAETAATVERAEAAVEQAQLNLSYTTITAPVDGIVGQRSVRVGAYVNAGTTLMAVVPLHKAYVVGNYRETQLTRVRVGERVGLRWMRIRPSIAGQCREHRAGNGTHVLASRPRQRNGQLHQGRSARAREDRPWTRTSRRKTCFASACRSSRTSIPEVRRNRSSHMTTRQPRHLVRAGLTTLSFALLTACTVGPNFVAPQAQVPEKWTPHTSATTQSHPVDASIDPKWWESVWRRAVRRAHTARGIKQPGHPGCGDATAAKPLGAPHCGCGGAAVRGR